MARPCAPHPTRSSVTPKKKRSAEAELFRVGGCTPRSARAELAVESRGRGLGRCLAVKGGRVLADWPGLCDQALYEGRDLAPTCDLRSVLKGMLRDHLGLSERALGASIFPDSAPATPLDGLIG